MRRFELSIKHALDFTVGILFIVALSPLFLLIALLIKLDSRGPVFFKQERVGKNGRLFTLYKFRSMINHAENLGPGLALWQNDSRITSVGNFLRKYSLDELPQIVNIIKGEMSFIGPRPTLLYQVKQYNDFQQKRLLMRPGISGWAQVNGRNTLSWQQRIALDVWYVEHYSIVLDVKIFFKTFPVIFNRKGIYGKEGINQDFKSPQK